MNNTLSIKTRFSAAATTYDTHTSIQGIVAKKVMTMIPTDLAPKQILEIGCGTGQLTIHLQQRFPDARIDALDLSPRMIEKAQANVDARPVIHWITADMETYTSTKTYDLMVSSSSLHWSKDLSKSLERMYDALAPSGALVISIMLEGTLQELHQARRKVAPHKIPPQGLLTREALLDVLENGHWNVLAQTQETYIRYHASAEALLRSLHEQGLTGGPLAQSDPLLSRGELNALKKEYDKSYGKEDKGVRASYTVGFVRTAK